MDPEDHNETFEGAGLTLEAAYRDLLELTASEIAEHVF